MGYDDRHYARRVSFGPGGGTPGKPVGLVHFAVASAEGTDLAERRFVGSRDVVRRRATEVGLWLMLGALGRAAAAGNGLSRES